MTCTTSSCVRKIQTSGYHGREVGLSEGELRIHEMKPMISIVLDDILQLA